ncbi:MAG: acyl carrier protein [Defluviitaleaceae bacterium]|nr:acyl carrier protein [Defluviitaleaceae bacterium]
MKKNEVIDKLTVVFRDVFDDNTMMLTETMLFKDIEGWDSLMHFTLISEIENAFNCKFKMSDLLRIKCVGDIISSICGERNGG